MNNDLAGFFDAVETLDIRGSAVAAPSWHWAAIVQGGGGGGMDGGSNNSSG